MPPKHWQQINIGLRKGCLLVTRPDGKESLYPTQQPLLALTDTLAARQVHQLEFGLDNGGGAGSQGHLHGGRGLEAGRRHQRHGPPTTVAPTCWSCKGRETWGLVFK